ncbi:hypothetical protein DHEL01_v207718 [Diaporthe helianthi]|uniref:Altered inheritance of mitochondria protein 6 n=1 Tax=Diaporthe helianthi TaxID=158607 RepID=A0A2P5HUI5_DIAHE|nr:hypothetical protein DHEL01_v207718 [Diaporthe helianthi]
MASSHNLRNLHNNRLVVNDTTSSSSMSLDGTYEQTIVSKVFDSGRQNIFNFVSGLLFLGFVAQSIYLYRLEAGLVRIANDPFDNWFGQEISGKRPDIWNEERQLFLRNVLPVPVHSHNDYKRRFPLFEALGSGCISVEADVHLKDNDLLVGHSDANLHKDVTLRSLYLDPLQRILEAQNVANNTTRRGVFNLAPNQTLVLLVDFKSSGPEAFAEMDAQLESLRDLDFLTYWNGTARINRPLTIVASGNSNFDSVLALNITHRDIFWDAKLENLVAREDNPDNMYKFNQSNSYFASTEFRNANFAVSPSYARTHPTQLEQARLRGLLTRYWDTPSDPPNERDGVWRFLVDAGVGVLNVDDLGAVRARAKGVGSLEQGTQLP